MSDRHPIAFGTDGWRAVIAEGFTFENLERVAQATAQWLHAQDASPSVVVGHDTRFLGRAFAERAAQVFAANGVGVRLADGFTSTPSISWAALARGCTAGVVITASHNPPAYNGFKIKGAFGGPATPAMIAEVEAELARLQDVPELEPFDALVADGRVVLDDVRAAYLDMLREQIDVAAIRAAGVRVAHDAMYGAGQGMLAELLGAERVDELHASVNPGFDGQAPEPIERNLGALAAHVAATDCAVGIANDGDADRIGMYDENGDFVSSHLLLALLASYLHETRGLGGSIVKTFSTTHMLDRMSEALGLPLETTPIGFKYIAPRILEGDVLVGGEESGGIAVKGHLPERDGIYIGLLVLEMVVRRGRPLSALVAELFERFGAHAYYRDDVHTTVDAKESVLVRLSGGGLEVIDGHRVERVEDLDGYKHWTAGGWLLVRPSGTEPVLRVYAEAPSAEAARALVEDAMRQLGLAETPTGV